METEPLTTIGNRYFDRHNHTNDDDDYFEEEIIQRTLTYPIEIAPFPVRNSPLSSSETMNEIASLSAGNITFSCPATTYTIHLPNLDSQNTELLYPQIYIDQFISNNAQRTENNTVHQTVSSLYEMDLICPM